MPAINYRATADLLERIWLFIPDHTRDAFASSEAMFRLVYGPPGTGKSELLLMELHTLVREYPGIEQCIWRKYRSDAKATIAKDLLNFFGEFGNYDNKDDVFHWRIEDDDQPGLIRTGSTYFRGFDEKTTRTRYGSFNIAYFHLAEAHEMTEKDFETARERIRQPGKVRIGGQLDAMNEYIPEGHWLEHWFLDPARSDPVKKNFEAFELKFSDMKNVYHTLGRDDYYQSRLDSVEGDDFMYKLKIAGRRPVASMEGDPMYPHYRPEQPDGKPWHFFPRSIEPMPGIVQIGMDLGPNHTYMAAVWWQYQLSGRVVVLRDLVLKNSTVEELARQMNIINGDCFPKNHFVVRTDRMILEKEKITGTEWSAQQMLAKHGIEALPGEQVEFKRREAVSKVLDSSIDGGPALIVCSNAREFHRGMAGGFCRDKNDRGVFGKAIKNEFSHVVEAFEHSYAMEWQRRSVIRAKRTKQGRPMNLPRYGLR